MYIASDIVLKGELWNETIEKLKPLFGNTLHYDAFILSVAIGIYHDKQIEALQAKETSDSYKSVPRSVLYNNANVLDILFKAAVVTTSLLPKMSEKDKMELAFNPDSKVEVVKTFNRPAFLLKFANYGIKQLAGKLTGSVLENIEAINKYMTECVSGLNLENEDIEITEEDLT